MNTTNPNAVERDGFRERALADLGVNVEVRHVHPGVVNLTLPTRILDDLIRRANDQASHHPTGKPLFSGDLG